ncbi:MAG: hypothetical protein EOR07_28395 [Mesorhizobium sp.]|nr:MAG: hypothetical protein EOR07_28395 [Mesorhizobium sp.]
MMMSSVAESYEPGAAASLVERRDDINANLLFTWRRQMRPPAVLSRISRSMRCRPQERPSAKTSCHTRRAP